jgi:hypothetical protein
MTSVRSPTPVLGLGGGNLQRRTDPNAQGVTVANQLAEGGTDLVIHLSH